MDSFPLDAREAGAGVIERGRLDRPRRAKSTKTSPAPLHARYIDGVVGEYDHLVEAPLGGCDITPLDNGRKAVRHNEPPLVPGPARGHTDEVPWENDHGSFRAVGDNYLGASGRALKRLGLEAHDRAPPE